MILILSGLPASGKTTESLRWVAEDPRLRRRINYDDIRVRLYGCKGETYFTQRPKQVRFNEETVKAEALHDARSWLTTNPIEHSIVVDNTNLTDRARSPWVNLGKELGIEVVLQDVDTPVAECVRRDRQRKGDDRVGRAVIERMALTTGWIDWDSPEYGNGKFVVVDIDGTLSDPSHRLHHVWDVTSLGDVSANGQNRLKPRWGLFHAEVDKDLPKPVIVDLVKHLAHWFRIIIVSGRSPEHGCGIKTEEWLDTHLGENYYDHLFMRAAGDYKPDYEHKQEILDLLPKDRIAFVLDDRDQVVDMWRKNGLTCLQCAEGAF